ncbi:hypothetical protein J2S00_003035 [Caldalkalibacillus uzonensis]|uniref:Uncharacterized protein n=1 Tax=Caldalkalibacillus uzonensis TaxID=353224 RepID=A0ABU0CX97_9BACI|nr:hypothetical protein [Caldalkalibacillus uzonensis]MDQ0340230.1 hypothetical protein [Caldalkalibacillus uzonensis]
MEFLYVLLFIVVLFVVLRKLGWIKVSDANKSDQDNHSQTKTQVDDFNKDFEDEDDLEREKRLEENRKKRKVLEQYTGKRYTFMGEVVTVQKGFRGNDIVLIRNLRFKDGTPVIEQIWIGITKAFEGIDLKEGTTLQFDAAVNSYERKGKQDYKLERATKVQVISEFDK